MSDSAGHNMYLIDVYPLARGVPFRTLSYFSSTNHQKDDVITVPFRSAKTPAVVAQSRSAHEAKTQIKSADYTLQKVSDCESKRVFHPAFIRAAETIADYFATTPGAVLYATAPETILAAKNTLPNIPHAGSEKNSKPPSTYIQDTPANCVAYYREIQKNTDGSVMLLAPTIQRAEKLFENFSQHTDKAIHLLHSGLSDDKKSRRWTEILTEDPPATAVITPGFASLPLANINTMIVADEGNDAYKKQHRPMLDWRISARIIADSYGAECFVGDTVLQLESWHTQKHDKQGTTNIQADYATDTRQLLVDMKTHTDDTDDGFALFSAPLTDTIKENKENHIFLLVGRKGMNPFTVCGDCGQTLMCDNCEVPFTLKQDGGQRRFECPRCNTIRDSNTVCDNCGSWKLWALGVGTDRVSQHLQENYSDQPIFQIDKDTTTTHTQARKTAKEFLAKDSGILVGTQMAIPYLDAAHTTGIVSIDSQLSIPDYNMTERVFRLLTLLRLKTEDTFILQTRRNSTTVLERALAGNVTAFFQDELEKREELGYPPFQKLIKISVTDFEDTARKEIQRIEDTISGYTTETYPAFHNQGGRHFRMHLLIKLPPEQWPDPDLLSLLRSLDTDIDVNVTPNSIL